MSETLKIIASHYSSMDNERVGKIIDALHDYERTGDELHLKSACVMAAHEIADPGVMDDMEVAVDVAKERRAAYCDDEQAEAVKNADDFIESLRNA